MFKRGQNVQQEFGNQLMKVIGFELDFIENVITQWEDEKGTIITGKFMESQLELIDSKAESIIDNKVKNNL